MNSMEQKLIEEKKKLTNITAPPELEQRLTKALYTKQVKFFPFKKWFLLSAAIILFIFITYQSSTFAYYGKKLLGFDTIMTQSLKDLNEDGFGQSIEQAHMLQNGTELTINGLVSDENRLVVYVTLTNENGLSNELSSIFNPQEITGFFTNAKIGGSVFEINDANTKMTGILNFDPVSAFSKKLKLQYYYWKNDTEIIEGAVTFPYNHKEALQTKMKQSINKKIKVDKGTVNFKTITATPTQTVIEGTFNVENYDRLSHGFDGVELIVNGQPLPLEGYSSSSSFGKNNAFSIEYGGLPKDVDSLEIHMKNFIGYKEINKSISLTGKEENRVISFENGELTINNIQLNDELNIRISTSDSILLDKVRIINEEQKKIPLKTTINQQLTKTNDETILNMRTLVFKTKSMPLELHIGGLHYMKEYNKKIDIPLE
ncbi:DUF4179 domain-containing protein [Niallia sp. JL1B1071]|uniref:DUF4179 domain-containing protein n=1 Tax=Niallia tiangongensis TaxID=3237105 RepID=UPI0037DCA796